MEKIEELEDRLNAVTYQYNMEMYAYCAERSRKHLASYRSGKESNDMFLFWCSAARGFKARALAVA